MKENNARQALDAYMDWLCELPEEDIRSICRGERIPCGLDFIWKIGDTEYTVVSHFKKDNADDVFHIMERLLKEDVSNPLRSSLEHGTIKVLQKPCSDCGNGGLE